MFFSQAGARTRTWEASPSEHKKWVEVFKACDEDNKGYLSREDFKVAVVMLFGYKPSKIEADSVMSSVNPNTSELQESQAIMHWLWKEIMLLQCESQAEENLSVLSREGA